MSRLFLPTSIVLLAAAFPLVAMLSCKSHSRPDLPPITRAADVERMNGGEYAPVPLDDMREVMTAKLVHTQAIVEGLARGDLQQVRANAERLEAVSELTAWMVHDTMTYIVLSDEFRHLVRRMADNAGRGDMDAVIVDYTALTHSCVQCHAYLKREREVGGLPGRVTQLNWSEPPRPRGG